MKKNKKYLVSLEPKDCGDELEVEARNKSEARKKAKKIMKKEYLDMDYYIGDIDELDKNGRIKNV